MPGFTQWPILREFIFVFSEILNFIFEQLKNIGITNVAVSIVLFSAVYQLLFLPFNISSGINASKNAEKKKALDALQNEYGSKLDDPEQLKEFNEKKETIEKKYKKKKKKGMGCLIFFVQFFMVMCMLNIVAFMDHYVRLLSAMDANALTRAYSIFGFDLRTVTNQDWWPAILFIVFYIAIFFLPGEIRRYKAEKKAKKEWLEGLSEEEREVVKEEVKKKEPLSVTMGLIRLISPILILFICLRVPCFIVVFWTVNIMWKFVWYRTARFMCNKLWPKIKRALKENKKGEQS